MRRRHPIGRLQVCWVVIGQPQSKGTKDLSVRNNFSPVISRSQHYISFILIQHIMLTVMYVFDIQAKLKNIKFEKRGDSYFRITVFL